VRITADQARDFEARGLIPPQPKRKPSHTPGVMNKTEAAWANQLEARRKVGEILSWRFEGLTLKLAPGLRYTPDFEVVMPNGLIQFHETKGGYAREDAVVKLKTAAVIFPEFRFFLCRRIRTEWIVEEVARV